MADLVLTDCFVSLGGTDVSVYVKSVSFPVSQELVDNTAMGDSTRQRLGGLKDSSLTVEFQQDFAVGLIDSIIWTLYSAGVAFAVAVRPSKTAAISTSNPEYQVSGLIESYTPIGGTVGERAMAPLSIQMTGAITRDTTP